MSASIIIPTYGRSDLLQQCLESVITTCPSDFEIIVADDCSPEPEKSNIELLAKRYEVNYLPSDERRAFAGNCNRAVDSAEHDFCILLNSDTICLDNWALPMLRWLKYDSIGIVGNMQLRVGADTVDHLGMFPYLLPSGDVFPRHLYQGALLSNLPKTATLAKIVPMVTGCCVAFDRAKILSLRGKVFDEGYTNGWEDVDLCYDLRVMHGQRVVIEPESRIVHFGGQSEGRFDSERRNQRKFLERWVHFLMEDPDLKSCLLADRRGENRPSPKWVGPKGNTEGLEFIF